MSGPARQEKNEQRSNEAVDIAFMTEAERTRKGKKVDFVFGRVTRLTGSDHARVAIATTRGSREVNARICNLLAEKRGATPISTRTVAIVYTGAEFNPDETPATAAEHFEITAILSGPQIDDLKKAKLVPDWMVAFDPTATIGAAAPVLGYEWEAADAADAEEDTAAGGKAAAGYRSARTARKGDSEGSGSDSDFSIGDI